MLKKKLITDWINTNSSLINKVLPLASTEEKGLMSPEIQSSFMQYNITKGTIWKICQNKDYARTSALWNIAVDNIDILIYLHVFLYGSNKMPRIEFLCERNMKSSLGLKLYVKNEENSHSLYLEGTHENYITVSFRVLIGNMMAEQVEIDTNALTLVHDFSIIE